MTNTIENEEAIEAVRHAVLDALDDVSKELKIGRWTDQDLPDLFRALDGLAIDLKERKRT